MPPGRPGPQPQRLAQIHQRVASDREREPGLERIHALDPGDHQHAGVEDRHHRGQPRLVVVLRAKEAQDRVREVALEDLGRGDLPVLEERCEDAGVATLEAAAQQHRRRGRRPGPLVEDRDPRLASRERLVEHRHVGQHQRQESEAGAGLGHGDEARDRGRRMQIAEPEREERRAAHVEVGRESRRPRHAAQVGAVRPVKHREGDHEPAGPQNQEPRDCQERVEAQEVLAPRAVDDPPPDLGPGSPQPAQREARHPVARRHAPRKKDGLERVHQHPADEDKRGEEHQGAHPGTIVSAPWVAQEGRCLTPA